MSENDAELASFIGCPLSSVEEHGKSLKELKAMLPIERTLHVMRALRTNSTELLAYLQKKHLSNVSHYGRILNPVGNTISIVPMRNRAGSVNRFCENEPYMLALLELIKTPLGPFNASETMSNAIRLLQPLPSLKKHGMHLIASIVRSHPDLSKFFNVSFFNIPDRLGIQYKPTFGIPATVLIYAGVIPEMAAYAPDVTIDDWKQCGLDPSNVKMDDWKFKSTTM